MSVPSSCRFGVVCILNVIESALSVRAEEIIAFVHLVGARIIGIAVRRALMAIAGASDALLIGGHGVWNLLLLQDRSCVDVRVTIKKGLNVSLILNWE